MLFVDRRSAPAKLRSTSQIQILRQAIEHIKVVLSKKNSNFEMYVLLSVGLYSDMLLSELCDRLPHGVLEGL